MRLIRSALFDKKFELQKQDFLYLIYRASAAV
jgi:hypothetical protein